MRDGEFYDILEELERAYDTNQKYLNLVLEHAMEDEYWFSKGVSEGIKKKKETSKDIEWRINVHYINAKITETKLGCLHDSGIMTFWIMLDFGSGEQGMGGYALDSYCKTAQKRLQTSLTGEVVHGILSALELDSWEDLKGKYVRIAVDCPGFGQNILGIGHIVKDKFLMVDEVMENYAG